MSWQTEDLLCELRPVAFGIGYRMLGSIAEAEDIAQEALLRIHRVLEEGEQLESPKAYVTTIATRLSIDALRSARIRREDYVGEWLPEPILGDPTDDPAGRAELSESLSLAFLVLLESLSPEQRAVFLLHDVFGYGYDEVAGIVGTSRDNARQLAVRARRYVRERRQRFEASPEQKSELAQRFYEAIWEGEVTSLEGLLAEEVVLYGDGGGKAPSLVQPIHGRSRVARTMMNWGQRGARVPGAELRRVTVNGQPGFCALDGQGRFISVMALDIADNHIVGVHSISNPDKLRHLGAVGDLSSLLKRSNR